MKKRSSYSIQLQERDVRIIELVSEFGYLTVQHLVDAYIFTGHRNARHRLLELSNAGFLSSYSRTKKGQRENLFYPNLEACRTVIDKDLLPRIEKTSLFKPWRNANKKHEDLLRKWALLIKATYPNAEIDLDFMLYNSAKLGGVIPFAMHNQLPDMVVYFDSEFSVNFEIELTKKSEQRYLKRMKKLMYSNYSPTIYLTDQLAIREIIQKTQSKLSALANTADSKTPMGVHTIMFNEIQNPEAIRAKFFELLSIWGLRDPLLQGGGRGGGTKNSQEMPIAL